MTPLINNMDRLKLFLVDERDALLMASADVRDRPECFLIGRRPVLPPGSSVTWVRHDFSRRCVSFMVQNDSFEPVGRGCDVPIETSPVGLTRIFAIREPDGRYRIDEVDQLFPESKTNA